MARLILKGGYIQAENAGGYMKYIATREGVEKLQGNRPPTQNQKRLIQDLLRDFPESAELFEYADFQNSSTVASASTFISMALDSNLHKIQSGEVYMKYIAERPGVEKHGAHGLFGQASSVDLGAALTELQSHQDNVWTLIFSLRREDATRLGYDNAANWRSLLLAQQDKLAEAMKIPAQNLRWYAAFHDAGHHPHIHLMVWSDDPKQGFLSKKGTTTLRSVFTNAIFKDELKELYTQKDMSYKQLTASAQKTMQQLIRQMSEGLCSSPAIEQKMSSLVQQLETVKGKKVYGYLKKPVKEQVDTIVDELAKLPEVAACYAEWNRLRDVLESYYHQQPRQHLPLSKQKEFKVIRNMVIHEAEEIRLGEFTFEDEQMVDEQAIDETKIESQPGVEAGRPSVRSSSAVRPVWQQAQEYNAAKKMLQDTTASANEKAEAVNRLEQLWQDGFSVAAHLLGKVWRDGLCGVVDKENAEIWFQRSAEAGNHFSEYALGKLLQEQGRVEDAVAWYLKAAEQGNQFAQYRLGKLYLAGEGIPKDTDKAINYLTASARQGNQYAQYTLGKLYLQGKEVEQNREFALEWLTQSAAQGNEYAQFFLDHFDWYKPQDPSVFLAATRLLHQLAGVFRENAAPPANPAGLRIDSKRRKKLLEKRLGMGHKPDDHEDSHMQNPSR